MLDSHGEVLKESLLFNERNELAKLAGTYPGALVVMQAGTHLRGSADSLTPLAWSYGGQPSKDPHNLGKDFCDKAAPKELAICQAEKLSGQCPMHEVSAGTPASWP